MPKDLKCASCAHYNPRKNYPEAEAWGECRLKAPAKSLVDPNGGPLYPSEPHHAVWPAVSRIDWCGEHQPKEG